MGQKFAYYKGQFVISHINRLFIFLNILSLKNLKKIDNEFFNQPFSSNLKLFFEFFAHF